METIFNYLRKIRNFVVNNPYVIFIISLLVVITWIGNFIISNNISFFDNRPNVKNILNILSIGFSVITAIYGFLSLIYSKINSIDKAIRDTRFDEIEKVNRNLKLDLASRENYIRGNCREVLEKIFAKFNLDNSSRITLFYCKQSCRKPTEFHILERYSKGGGKDHYQPESSYLISIGVIKYVWESGFYSDVGKCPMYPESGKKVLTKRKEYIQYQLENYAITEEMIKNMNMKSCDFIGKNLSNDLANLIILFESNKTGKLSHLKEEDINRFLDSTFLKEYLISHVELLNWVSSKQFKELNVINEPTSNDIMNELGLG